MPCHQVDAEIFIAASTWESATNSLAGSGAGTGRR
jgi:hypothetical protein